MINNKSLPILGILLITLVACASMSSALDLFEKKTYYEDTRTVTIDEAFLGIKLPDFLGGGEIASASLKTEQVHLAKIGPESLVAEITLSPKQSYEDAIEGIETYNINKETGEMTQVVKTFVFKEKTIDEKTGETVWTRLNNLDLLAEEKTIGIFTEVKEGDYVEWIPTMFGVRVEEWAIYASDPALMAYYSLNELTGTGVNDSTNYRSNGSIDTGNLVTYGKIAGGYDNNAGYIGLSNQSLLNLGITGAREVSVAAWINVTNDGYIVARDQGIVIAGTRYRLRYDSTNVYWISGQTGETSFARGADNIWVFVVGTTNATHNSLYVNGTLVDIETIGAAGTIDSDTFIGRRLNNQGTNTGLYDEVSIWNRTLSASDVAELFNNYAGLAFPFVTANITVQIRQPFPNASVFSNTSLQVAVNSSSMNFSNPSSPGNSDLVNTSIYILNQSMIDLDNDPSLVANWRLDTNYMADSSLNKYNLLVANVNAQPNVTSGIYGGAVRSVQVNEGTGNNPLYAPAEAPINVSSFNNFTYTFWSFNSNCFGANASHGIGVYGKNFRNAIQVTAFSGGNTCRFQAGLRNATSGGANATTTTGNLTSGWHYVTAVYSMITNQSGNMSLYIDGRINNSAILNISLLPSDSPAGNNANFSFIGASAVLSGNNKQGNITLDDFRVYNRSLSASEIFTIYNNTQPRFTETYSATYSRLTNTTIQVNERGLHQVFAWTTNLSGFGAGNGTIFFYTQPNYSITLHTPLNNSNYTTSNVTFAANASGGAIATYNFTLLINGANNFTTQGTLGGDVGFNQTYTLVDGNYNWTAVITDFNGTNTTTETRFFRVDTVGPTVTIFYPSGVLNGLSPGSTIPVNFSAVDPNLGSCIRQYNNINTTISCSANTSISYSLGINSVTIYANDTFGNLASSTATWMTGITFNNVSYNASAYETSYQGFVLNFSSGAILSSTAIFNYNGTNYTSTVSCSGGNCSAINNIDLPTISSGTQQNLTFRWFVSSYNGTDVINFNTDILTQSVNQVSLTYCQSGVITANYTAYDEQNLTRFSNFSFDGSFNYYLGMGTKYRTLNVTNSSTPQVLLCIGQNETFKFDAIIAYSAPTDPTPYTPRNHFYQGRLFNNIKQDMPLLLLKTSDSTSFVLQVQSRFVTPVQQVLINAQRCYPGTNTNQTVFISRTDSNGLTTGNFEAEIGLYQFFVTNYSNVLLAVTPCSAVVPQTAPFTLLFQLGTGYTSPFDNIQNYTDITGSLYFNYSTKTVTFTYEDTSSNFSSAQLIVRTLNFSGFYQPTICVNNNTLAAGIISCQVPLNGSYTATGYVIRTNTILADQITFVVETFSGTVGYYGAFLGWFIILVCAFAFKFNEIAGIFLINVAVIFCNLVGLIAFGPVFITSLICLSIIITAVLER